MNKTIEQIKQDKATVKEMTTNHLPADANAVGAKKETIVIEYIGTTEYTIIGGLAYSEYDMENPIKLEKFYKKQASHNRGNTWVYVGNNTENISEDEFAKKLAKYEDSEVIDCHLSYDMGDQYVSIRMGYESYLLVAQTSNADVKYKELSIDDIGSVVWLVKNDNLISCSLRDGATLDPDEAVRLILEYSDIEFHEIQAMPYNGYMIPSEQIKITYNKGLKSYLVSDLSNIIKNAITKDSKKKSVKFI